MTNSKRRLTILSERQELSEVLDNLRDYPLLGTAIGLRICHSRQELLAQGAEPARLDLGEYRRGLPFALSKAAEHERQGRIGQAVRRDLPGFRQVADHLRIIRRVELKQCRIMRRDRVQKGE